MVEVYNTIAGLRQVLKQRRQQGASVSFVPTMGFLHDGHLSLMRLARERGDVLVASIFVNPTQFAPGEDLEAYPRDLERDLALCQSVGVDIVFTPEPSQMYHPKASTTVTVAKVSQGLCGTSRPTHFQGVATVVTKLFNIVQPDVAVFGQKDYQQLAVIRRMVRDLDIPVEIVGGAIVREADGLAMSSRNVYLSETHRAQATALVGALRSTSAQVDGGQRSAEALLEHARGFIGRHAPAGRIDYVELVDPLELTPVVGDMGHGGAVMALAVFFGQTRLIDNMHLGAP